MVGQIAPKVSICGIGVSQIDRADLLTILGQLVSEKKGARIMTVAAWTLVHASENVRFREALNRASIVLADGWPVVVLSKLKGSPLPEVVTGAGLVPDLVRESQRTGVRILLLGSGPGVASIAADRLNAQFPGALVFGETPPMVSEYGEKELAESLSLVDSRSPSVVFVGISVPKGELLLDKLAELRPSTIFIGVGGGIDNAAGLKKRAPAIFRALYLEGPFRILQDPHLRMPRAFEILFKFPKLVYRDLRTPRSSRTMVS